MVLSLRFFDEAYVRRYLMTRGSLLWNIAEPNAQAQGKSDKRSSHLWKRALISFVDLSPGIMIGGTD